MKRFTVGLASLVLLGSVSASCWAAGSDDNRAVPGPESTVFDANTAFQFLMTLAGDWNRGGMRSGDEHEHAGANTRVVSFRNSAAGSAVIETFFAGQDNEMISVYHWDGNELLLTHYCALQNAPIMKFVKSEKPGEIKFEFKGGTNFDPAVDSHVHEGVFRVRDKNTVESDFVGYSNGKPGRGGTKSLMMRKEPK